jgi:hypothetical protein
VSGWISDAKGGNVSRQSTKHAIVSPWLCAALSMLLIQRSAYAALPPAAPSASDNQPAKTDTNARPAPPSGTLPESGNADKTSTEWSFPPVRLGGTLSYTLRRDNTPEQQSVQKALDATVMAKTGSFIWQPWFAQWAASLGLTLTRDANDRNQAESENSVRSKSAILTGNTQLAILPMSRFPFEAHFEKNDSRLSSENLSVNDFSSQRVGFTQHYMRPEGDAMIGWDRNTQKSDSSGVDRQDSLQVNASETIDMHRLQLSGNYAHNVHEMTDESGTQHNITIQHTYTPVQALSVDSMLNLGRSAYHLTQGANDTRLSQLSSIAFWRPEESPVIVTGGVRLLGVRLENDGIFDTAAGALQPQTTRLRNVNVNAGVSYDLNRFTRLNATANTNQIENNERKTTSGTQSAGVTYQPDAILFGQFRYNWNASGNLTNRTGGQDSGRQVTAQLSHNIGRAYRFESGSGINVEMSQGVSAIRNNSIINNENSSVTQLVHSGSIGWDSNSETGNAMVRLSASDSRSISGRKEMFQMVNLQASSSMPSGGHSYWGGNLTIQAVRQATPTTITDLDPVIAQELDKQNKQFVTTSSGTLTYQHTRPFGVRGLRFASDLRLNSQALLPVLGGPKDQETAAWENRFDYTIGRLQVRLSMLVARSTFQRRSVSGITSQEKVEDTRRLSKSIMLMVSRSFGDF